jgi:SanA protein
MKKKFDKSSGWFKRHRTGCLMAIILCIGFMAAAVISADRVCQRAAAGRIFRSAATVPEREVGLVLGASRTTRRGAPNLHFTSRIETAAALYKAGKVHHLLVSGDNHTATYDEPTDMMNALMAKGVPAAAITRDYAGFRTLDSVVRAKTVFGLKRCLIITEAYHCPRALWIAQNHGLEAVAFAAPDVAVKSWSLRAEAREELARTWCALDLYVLHRQPKFAGPKEPAILSVVLP